MDGYAMTLPELIAEETRIALLLVGYNVPVVTLMQKTFGEIAEAKKWAVRAHLRASDNNVRASTMPGWLKEYGRVTR